MTFATRILPHASLVAATIALSACGGGGGSASSSSGTGTSIAPVSITSANMQDVGAQGYSASSNLNAQVNGSTSPFVTGVTVDTPSAGMVGAALQGLYRAMDAVKDGNNTVVGVTTTQTVPCSGGGTMQVTATVASSTAISAGDTLTLNASACKESGYTLNGGLGITFKSISGIPGQSTSWNGAFSITYTGFSIAVGTSTDTAKATGDMSVSVTQSGIGAASFTVSGSSFKIDATHNGSTASLTLSNFSYGASLKSGVYTYNANFGLSGNLGKLGTASFTVKTLTDFKQTETGYPTQGAMKISAADNSSLTLTAIDGTNVKLDLDKNGDGVVDDSVTTTWTALQGRL